MGTQHCTPGRPCGTIHWRPQAQSGVSLCLLCLGTILKLPVIVPNIPSPYPLAKIDTSKKTVLFIFVAPA